MKFMLFNIEMIIMVNECIENLFRINCLVIFILIYVCNEGNFINMNKFYWIYYFYLYLENLV